MWHSVHPDRRTAGPKSKGHRVRGPVEDLRIALTCREATELAWRAVDEIIQPTAGSTSVRPGERLERIWRDLSTGRTHVSSAVLLTTVANRAYTQLRLQSGR